MRQLTAEPQKLLTDPLQAKLWRQGLNDPDSLTADERVSFFSQMYLVVNVADARLVYESVTRDPNAYDAEASTVEFLADNPGFIQWWRMAKSTYNAEMIAYVDGCISQSQVRGAVPDAAQQAVEPDV